MAGQQTQGKSVNFSSPHAFRAGFGSSTTAKRAAPLLLLLSLWPISLAALARATRPRATAGKASPTSKTSGSPAPTGTGVGDGSVAALEQLEMQMLDAINRDRMSPAVYDETKGRARPLEWDARLAGVARAHSEEMAATGSFSHEGADGSAPVTRVTNAAVRWLTTGENIAKIDLGTGFVPISIADANREVVAYAESLLMGEPKFRPNHRGNILNPAYNHVGIGIARAADGSFYITQEFAQLR